MELGKIVQLVTEPLENDFKVTYGLSFNNSRVEYDFASLVLSKNYFKETYHKYIYSYVITKENDGYKEFMLSVEDEGEKPKQEFIEEYLFVIIPFTPGLETQSERIAGRYRFEVILKMKEGETLQVFKGNHLQKFMIVRAENELFIVEKKR